MLSQYNYRDLDDEELLEYKNKYDRNNNIINGKLTIFNNDGSLNEEINYKNGKKHGEYKKYINNKLCYKSNYYNNILNGLYQEFYPNGKLKLEYNYNNYIINGIYKEYYESGELLEKCSYKNGNKDGRCYEYYENGNIKYECMMINGLIHGLLKEYNEHGVITNIYRYHNNIMIDL